MGLYQESDFVQINRKGPGYFILEASFSRSCTSMLVADSLTVCEASLSGHSV